MFRFAHPEFLYLLLIIPILIGIFVFVIIQKQRNIKKFGNPELLAELMPNVSRIRPHLKFYMQLIAFVLIIIALAQPQFGTREVKETRQGVELMIALDISNSMLAQDIQPNRLEKAKMILSRIIDNMTNDKVGLVVFAGDAFTQLPITVDYVSAKMFLSTITPKLITRQGTAIGSAIEMSIKSFGEQSDKSRAIVLITDGENHEDDAVGAAKLALDKGIVVHVVGIGKPEGAPIPVDGTMSFWKDKDGNVVVSKLNEEMGKSIAAAGGGVYVRADNNNSAFRILTREFDKMAKSEIQTTTYADYNEQFQSFALLALILLLIDAVVFERKNKRLSKLRIFDIKDKFLKNKNAKKI